MYNVRVLICLTAVAFARARPHDGSDLNLKSIFRTPRDFSKVNFDHFELLERNNFNDETKTEAESVRPDKNSKSIANAQVLLRIGGEDIKDCKRVTLSPRTQAITKDVILDANHHGHLPLLTPTNIPYPYMPPVPVYPFFPPAPYNFPGFFYNPRFSNYLPFPHFPWYNDKVVHGDLSIHGPGAVNSVVPTNKVVDSAERSNKKVITKKTSQEMAFMESLTNPDQTIAARAERFEASGPVREVTVNAIQSALAPDRPLPTNVEYVEVNLEHAGDRHLDSQKDNIVSLLDQATVPLSSHRNPLSMSFPEEQEMLVSRAPAFNSFCDSCNAERNLAIPYGQKFAKDIDSLVNVVESKADFRHVPSTLYNAAPSDNLIKVHPGFPNTAMSKVADVEWPISNAQVFDQPITPAVAHESGPSLVSALKEPSIDLAAVVPASREHIQKKISLEVPPQAQVIEVNRPSEPHRSKIDAIQAASESSTSNVIVEEPIRTESAKIAEHTTAVVEAATSHGEVLEKPVQQEVLRVSHSEPVIEPSAAVESSSHRKELLSTPVVDKPVVKEVVHSVELGVSKLASPSQTQVIEQAAVKDLTDALKSTAINTVSVEKPAVVAEGHAQWSSGGLTMNEINSPQTTAIEAPPQTAVLVAPQETAAVGASQQTALVATPDSLPVQNIAAQALAKEAIQVSQPVYTPVWSGTEVVQAEQPWNSYAPQTGWSLPNVFANPWSQGEMVQAYSAPQVDSPSAQNLFSGLHIAVDLSKYADDTDVTIGPVQTPWGAVYNQHATPVVEHAGYQQPHVPHVAAVAHQPALVSSNPYWNPEYASLAKNDLYSQVWPYVTA